MSLRIVVIGANAAGAKAAAKARRINSLLEAGYSYDWIKNVV